MGPTRCRYPVNPILATGFRAGHTVPSTYTQGCSTDIIQNGDDDSLSLMPGPENRLSASTGPNRLQKRSNLPGYVSLRRAFSDQIESSNR